MPSKIDAKAVIICNKCIFSDAIVSRRILVTGGASANDKILQIISDVFNAPVYIQVREISVNYITPNTVQIYLENNYIGISLENLNKYIPVFFSKIQPTLQHWEVATVPYMYIWVVKKEAVFQKQ